MNAWRTFARTSAFKRTASALFKTASPPNQTDVVEYHPTPARVHEWGTDAAFRALFARLSATNEHPNILIVKVKDL